SAAVAWPSGGCCAAIPGRREAWTTRDPPAGEHLEHPRSARARHALDPGLLPLLDRAAVGLVDRGADDPRPDRPRAADRAADPLDAVAAGARAADEGDPEEVQGRAPEAQRRADEVLQGEQHQPGRVVPADGRAAAG